MKYIITVFLNADYTKGDQFLFETDKSIVNTDGEGRLEINYEVNARYTEWYYYDIDEYESRE